MRGKASAARLAAYAGGNRNPWIVRAKCGEVFGQQSLRRTDHCRRVSSDMLYIEDGRIVDIKLRKELQWQLRADQRPGDLKRARGCSD
jgi:hypothetical protein